MLVDFASLNIRERPVLILKTAGDAPIGVLGNARNVHLDIQYNETSTLEFELPYKVDGVDTPFYDDVIGMRIIDVNGVGLFTLVSPEETDSGVEKVKMCTAYSLEYEFAYKKITIGEGTFKFWDANASKRTDTILGMVMELMPSWRVGRVPDAVANKYRTFEINNENLYNFLKGTAQETYNCIFEFDTYTRTVNVRDIDAGAIEEPVFISTENLAREIVVTEETENIVTRLDVNGADGVSIRDVNPTGTNKIINLDYFMNTTNFTQQLVDKYNAWKQLCADERAAYYSESIQYSLAVEQKATEQAKLVDMQGELVSLDNVRGVVIQGMAQGLSKQSDLDKANADYRSKEAEIADQELKIASIEKSMKDAYARIEAIRDACSYERYFTSDERKEMDRYIKDGEVSESSFVASSTVSYTDTGTGSQVSDIDIAITGSTIERIEDAFSGTIYDVSGGDIVIGDLSAAVVSAVVDVHADGSMVATAYLNKGTRGETEFQTACVSVSGNASSVNFGADGNSLRMHASGYMYFSLNATEYQRRSVAWDLYEYGEETLARLSQPTFSFSVDSTNFLAIDDFVAFKNSLRIGEKVYIDIAGRVLKPICIGVVFQYEDLPTLELEFSDSYTSSDSSFKLVDLLNKSVSMGRTVDVGKFEYSAFVDSGASSAVKEFMNSTMDVAKNAILSSSDQAVSWDGAGFKLRKWANEEHSAYADEQIWMNNNSIVMTDDGWNTAQLAIGKFHDENTGDCWGIFAPMIMGTLIAGSSLVIESAKKDGGTAVFRMDADGCRLYNTDFSIAGTNAHGDNVHIVLNPEIGMALGTYPVYSTDDEGKPTVNVDNAKFWVDMEGNLHFKGTLEGANGYFDGNVTARSLLISDEKQGEGYTYPVNERFESVEAKVTPEAIENTVKNSQSFTDVKQTADKITWVISGEDEASMTLTQHMIEIISDNFIVTDEILAAIADNIDLTANDSIELKISALQSEIDRDYVKRPEFTRVVRIDNDGLHVGDNQSDCETVMDSYGLSVVVGGERYSRFASTYAQFGNYQLGLHPDEGGLIISPTFALM